MKAYVKFKILSVQRYSTLSYCITLTKEYSSKESSSISIITQQVYNTKPYSSLLKFSTQMIKSMDD